MPTLLQPITNGKKMETTLHTSGGRRRTTTDRKKEEEKEKIRFLCRPKLAAASVCMKYPPARGHKRERENSVREKKTIFFAQLQQLLLHRLLGNLLTLGK
jgi:hypothetical protein